MSDPALPEDDGPAGRDGSPIGRSSGEGGERSMSLAAAGMWSVGVTLLFIWLLVLMASFKPSSQPDLVTTFGCQAAAYLLGLFGILRLYAPRAGIRDFIGLRPTHLAFYPLAVALGVSLEAPISALYEILERRWPGDREGDLELVRLLSEGTLAERISLGLVIVALGPLIEEVLFRGALTRPLRRRYPAAPVIAATALLFALAHLQWQKFLPIGLFGVALGVLRYASGSLVPSVLLHATYNAIPFAAMLGARAGEGAASPPYAVERAALEGPALPGWVVGASSASAALLLVFAVLLGARAADAARARERDQP